MYTLYKLSEGFIVTSDEEYKNNDFVLLPLSFELRKCVNGTTFIEGTKKVIAQQDQIDFSVLSEEKQKEIGWFDEVQVYKFANEAMEGGKDLPKGLIEYRGKAVDFAFDKYIQGFQKAQELLSDRMFTIEDVVEFCKTLTSTPSNISQEAAIILVNNFLSQPKSWEIECEWKNGKLHILKLL